MSMMMAITMYHPATAKTLTLNRATDGAQGDGDATVEWSVYEHDCGHVRTLIPWCASAPAAQQTWHADSTASFRVPQYATSFAQGGSRTSAERSHWHAQSRAPR